MACGSTSPPPWASRISRPAASGCRANAAPRSDPADAMELRIFAEPQEGASYEQQLTMARAAESFGFGAFFRSDHLLRIKPGSGLPGPTDSWVTLGAIARETGTVRLGTMVTSAT